MSDETCAICRDYGYANCPKCGAHFLSALDDQCFDCRDLEEKSQ